MGNKVLNAVPANKDVDVLSDGAIEKYEKGELSFVPAVAGAVSEIFKKYKIDFVGKKIAIVGRGRLVGRPVRSFFAREGAEISVINRDNIDSSNALKEADIIVSGAGSPYLIKPYMIKEGVALIDAGTAEKSGKLVGDIDPECKEKASLYAPVPGGVGPITIAILFRNLLQSK